MNAPIPLARAIQGAVRAALSAADELSRHEHDEHAENTAQHLAALRTTLAVIDVRLGREETVERVEERLVDELHNVVLKLRRLGEDDSPILEALLDEADALEQRLRGREQPTVSTDMSSMRQSIYDGLRAMRRPPVFAGMLIGTGLVTGAIALAFALRRR